MLSGNMAGKYTSRGYYCLLQKFSHTVDPVAAQQLGRQRANTKIPAERQKLQKSQKNTEFPIDTKNDGA
jgi:hypothetical protein